ncbi:hypothetical protein JIG36_41765 [Actinoplanes sp. LDG1-06]|uniref:Novel STAND NTPase 1 domain-containing protein n=1 Tax=Paractinoplanes ovalisporus TaxID=2810368 RepID=A0ABS2AQG8_9ACTN|nr:hypothetical protein [Actinoplanes ovalisporus]MBM2622051.1 hypothetical protein [Actinoplanes ovalisporus]
MGSEVERSAHPPEAQLPAVHTREEFVDLLGQLSESHGGTQPVRVIALASKRAGHEISPTTVHNIITGVTAPTRASLVGFLYGCGIPEVSHEPWLAKHRALYPTKAEQRRAATARARSRPVDRPWPMVGAGGSDARAHFTARANGYRSRALGGDLFRGRSAAVEAVCSWLTRPDPPGTPIVVTGQPGAGKSAVLARACLQLEERRRWAGVGIHARGATSADVVAAVASAAGAPGADSADALLDALDTDEDSPSLLVAVDALDEVSILAERRAITQLLVELARLPTVRVAIATRPLSSGDRYGMGALLPALGVLGPDDRHLVDLDTDEYFEIGGLRDFAAAVLAQEGARHPGPPGAAWVSYRADPVSASRLSDVVARRADRNYLVAALAATHLSGRADVVDADAPGFDENTVPSTVGEAITKYLEILPEGRQALTVAMLTALAYSHGDGIHDSRWIAFTRALRYEVSQLDIDTLRNSPAADYLLQTNNDATGTVTRLFHQALVDDLVRRRPDRRSDNRALFETLLPSSPTGWSGADEYCCSHAGQHSAAAGTLTRLLLDIEYLLVADLDRLLPLLPAQPDAHVAPIVGVLRNCHHRARVLPADRRAGLFSVDAASVGLEDLRNQLATIGAARRRVRWSHDRGQLHQQIATGLRSVVGLAVGRLAGNDVIVAVSRAEGQVRIWNSTGQVIGEFVAWHAYGGVTALAMGRLGDRDVIATAGSDNAARIWTTTGQQIMEPLTGHMEKLTAIAIGGLGGRDVVVTASTDYTARIWDRSGALVSPPLTGHRGSLTSVAIGRLGKHEVVATASKDGTVRLWNSRGEPVGTPLAGHSGAVLSVTIGQLDGRDVVVTAGADRSVRIWGNASSRRPSCRPLTGHTNRVLGTAVGRHGDNDVIVSAGIDGTVRIWDDSGRSIGQPLAAHRRAVPAVAVGRLDGRDVVVSAGADRAVRIWENVGRSLGTPLVGPKNRVLAMAAGRVGERDVVVTAEAGSVRFWDNAGRPSAEPQFNVTGDIIAIAVDQTSADGGAVIVGADGFGRTRMWDADGRSVGQTPAVRASWLSAGPAVVGLGIDGPLVGIQNYSAFTVKDLRSGTVVGEVNLGGHRETTVVLGRLGDRNVVAAPSDNVVRWWDLNGQSQGILKSSHRAEVTGLTIGRLLRRDVIVSAGSDAVQVFDSNGRRLARISGHRRVVTALAAATGGGRDLIAFACDDCSLRVWDVQAREYDTLDLLDQVISIAILPDGALCAATTTGLCFWNAPRP